MTNQILDKKEDKVSIKVKIPVVTLSKIASNYRKSRMLDITPGLRTKSIVFRR